MIFIIYYVSIFLVPTYFLRLVSSNGSSIMLRYIKSQLQTNVHPKIVNCLYIITNTIIEWRLSKQINMVVFQFFYKITYNFKLNIMISIIDDVMKCNYIQGITKTSTSATKKDFWLLFLLPPLMFFRHVVWLLLLLFHQNSIILYSIRKCAHKI